MKVIIAITLALLIGGCNAANTRPWNNRQISGDSLFYFHSKSGSTVSRINQDAINYCASRGKSAVLASREAAGEHKYHSNYACQ